MVGEIRDEETARTAIQAALTGHLVFSTLHTNDACSAITRLINMGVEPYLIGAALNMVLAQRLVRRICSKCRQTYEPPRTIRKALERMGYEFDDVLQGRRAARAAATRASRAASASTSCWSISDEMRDAIVADPTIGNLRRIAARRRHDHAAARRLPQGPRRNHHGRRDLPDRGDVRERRRESTGSNAAREATEIRHDLSNTASAIPMGNDPRRHASRRPTLEDAAQQLRRDGFQVLELEEADDEPACFPRRVSKNEIIYVTSQLAIMVDTGITLSTALARHRRAGDQPDAANAC